jgi:hypothetical protein
MMSRTVKISEELEEARRIFQERAINKIGYAIPKIKSDRMLAQAIQESNILNFEMQLKKKNKRGRVFDLEF